MPFQNSKNTQFMKKLNTTVALNSTKMSAAIFILNKVEHETVKKKTKQPLANFFN